MIKQNLLHSNSSCSLKKYPGYPCIKVKMLILIFAFWLIFKTFISFQNVVISGINVIVIITIIIISKPVKSSIIHIALIISKKIIKASD